MESELRPKDDSRGGWGGKKKRERRERSAVKTRRTPDKVLVFCVRFMRSRDPENLEELQGPKSNPECETSATDRLPQGDRRRTDPEIICGCFCARSSYILDLTCICDVSKSESLLASQSAICFSSVALNFLFCLLTPFMDSTVLNIKENESFYCIQRKFNSHSYCFK